MAETPGQSLKIDVNSLNDAFEKWNLFIQNLNTIIVACYANGCEKDIYLGRILDEFGFG